MISDYIFRAVHSVHFRQYRWDKAFHFPGKFHFLVKAVTDSVRLGVVDLNLVLSTANGVMLGEIYLQAAAHNDITTIHDLFQNLFFENDNNLNLLYCNCQ